MLNYTKVQPTLELPDESMDRVDLLFMATEFGKSKLGIFGYNKVVGNEYFRERKTNKDFAGVKEIKNWKCDRQAGSMMIAKRFD